MRNVYQMSKHNNAGIMKTTKIILSSALIALAIAVLPEATGQIDVYAAAYSPAAYSPAAPLNGFTYEAFSGSGISHDERAEAIMEDGVEIEEWMAIPFEDAAVEEELFLEEWMTVPFENSVSEERLLLEGWMCTPFEKSVSEERLLLEAWMCTPFENSVAEERLLLEGWMCTPFELKETRGCMVAQNK
jgi:hypothetical protein